MEDLNVQNKLKAVLGPGVSALGGAGSAKKTEDGKTFADALAESLDQVNELQKNADQAIEDLVTGESESIHDTMLAVSKADLAFRMTMQVRNKVVEAYQEVLRMQV